MNLSTLVTAKLSRFFSSSSSSSSSSSCIQNLLKQGFTPTLKSINRLLLFLSKTRRWNLILRIFTQMDRSRVKGDSQTHCTVTWALLKLKNFQEAEHFIKTKIPNSSTTRMWDSLIQGFCIKENNPEKALVLLRHCLNNDGILPSSFTFRSLIHRFVSQGNMNAAIEALELMNNEKLKYPYDNFVCSSIISGFCKMGKPDLAMEFFENAVNVGALRPNVVTYTSLVSALCMLNRVGDVCDLVCKMEKEGLAFDVVFYSCWICGFLRQKMLMEAFLKHREMVGRGIAPDTISYTILIDGLSKEGNVEKAAAILGKMIEDGLKPNLVTYTAIVFGYCRKGKMNEALAVFKMVEDIGIRVDEFMYAILIDAFCRRGDFDRVYQLLEEMEKKGTCPSAVTYNTLINGLCKTGRTFDADEVSKGIARDTFTYSTLLHGYVVEENVIGILEIKRKAEEAGVGMDTVMCNIIIKALMLMGAFEDADALYKGMHDMDLVANSITYCTLIDGYCNVGRIDEALEIFDTFRRTLISSVECYNCMINGLCKNGMVDVATEVFIELNEQGLTLDVGIYMILIKAVLKEKSVDGVLNLIYRLESLGVSMYKICSGAVSLFCKTKFPMAASEVYKVGRRNQLVLTSNSYYSILLGLMGEGNFFVSKPILSSFIKDYGLIEPNVVKILLHYLGWRNVNDALYFLHKIEYTNPNVTIPVCTLKALARDGRVLAAYELLKGAKDNLPVMGVVEYSIIVDGLCKGGHLIQALDLCAFAEQKKIALNIITYNSVINGLCHQGCLVEAFRLFDSLERINLVPSHITYAILIDNLCKEGYLLDAKQLFQRMVVQGLEANVRIYNSFINGYCKFGQMEEALKIMKNMEVKCLDPDAFTVSFMIYGYCRNGDMEAALGFFFEYQRKGRSPDFLGFLHLIRGLCAKGRMEESRSILREMLQSPSILELLKTVNTDVDTESIDSLLVILCEQGSIKEAVAILDEVGVMFFPVRNWCGSSHISKESFMIAESDALTAVGPKDETSIDGTPLENVSCEMKEMNEKVENFDMEKKSHFNNFDMYYSQIASLCSRGQPYKASGLAKEMLASLSRDCG